MSSRPATAGKLGFWMCLALVVGNTIGSGVYLLPASLAPFGRNNVTGWAVTAAGAIALGVVFAALSRELGGNGGPYAATREAFGPLPAFVVAWGYWVCIWVGNAAIATGAVSYTSALVPWITGASGASALVTLAAVWLLTLVNCLGVRAAGWLQAVTTLVKLIPLVLLPLAAMLRLRPEWLTARVDGPPLSLDATAAAATLALWAVLGFESATVPADKTHDPARTIPRATLVGTLASTLLCALACAAVLLVVPSETLRVSNAPFADAARTLFGETAAVAVSLFAAVSAYGALNGWILLQGELPQQMARAGAFPRRYAQASRRGTPVFALCSTSLLVTVLVLMNFGRGMVEVFTFMVLLSTTANLVAYLACSLALLVLLRRGRIAGRRAAWLAWMGALGAAYSLWAIAGAGPSALFWGAILILLALPVHALMRGFGPRDRPHLTADAPLSPLLQGPWPGPGRTTVQPGSFASREARSSRDLAAWTRRGRSNKPASPWRGLQSSRLKLTAMPFPLAPPPRVLLIDADTTFLAELQSQSGMALMRLEQATGDAHALRLLRRVSYDIVLTSPKSAITEDLALLEEMQLVRPCVKAIVLAPSATPEEVIASLRAHAFACFTAPFPMGEVAEMIRRAVQNPDWKDGLQVVSARANWLSLRVDCRRLAADRLIRFLTELARELPDVTRDDLLAAFREVALNAMEHGAGFAPDQVIDVTAVRTKRAIVYYVKDPGPGFSPDDLKHAAVSNPPDDPVAHVDERARLGLRPGGFGLLIARSVVDEFLHSEKANEVLLIKHTS